MILPSAAVLLTSALAKTAGEAATAGAVAGSVQQVFHAGTVDAPSTAIPDCPKLKKHSQGCFQGQKLTVQAVPIGQTAAEPTIGVAPDGTAYMAGSTLVVDTDITWGVARTDTMRSEDGGLTWKSVQLRDPVTQTSVPGANADPMIYVDPTTGRVFNFDLEGACIFLNYSDDKGKTWTTNPLACGNVPVDHQTIVAAKPVAGQTTSGYPNVLYWCSNRIVDSACGVSLDGGDTWQPGQGTAYQGFDADNNLCSSITGHLAADPQGRLFLPSAHCNFPEIAISTDGANTWTDVTVSKQESRIDHTSVASDAAGNLYYVWIENKSKLPFLATSTDHGKTWSQPMMIAPPGVQAANFPVVAAGDAGRIAITFPSTTLKTPASGDVRPWDQTVLVSTNALDASPAFFSATANAPDNPIHRGACAGRCGGLWDFIDIQIAPTGELWAATSDDCKGNCLDGNSSVNAHIGDGIAIRQIGGPLLRTPAAATATERHR